MKNKIFASLLALCVALSLSACNSPHHASSESSTTISSSKILNTSSKDKSKEKQKSEEEKKKQKELKAKKEAKKRQAEINQKTSEATNAIVQAEANPTRDTYTAASTAIQAIPGGNQDLANRLANVDSTIKANETAQAEAARVAEQQAQEQARQAAVQAEQQKQAQAAQEQAAAQAQQQNNQETVLITPTGKKYHNHACGNGNYSPVTLQEALNRGLTACEKCFN